MKAIEWIIIIAVLAVGFGAIMDLSSNEEMAPIYTGGILELTEQDLFASHANLPRGDLIAFRGLKVGSSLEDVVDVFGTPDHQTAFDEGDIVNVEYGPSLGYNFSAVIFNLEDNEVQRLTLHKPIDSFFAGSTKYGYGKRKVYDTFGIPDEQLTGRYNIWLYTYPDKGIDVILYEKKISGLSFYKPQ